MKTKHLFAVLVVLIFALGFCVGGMTVIGVPYIEVGSGYIDLADYPAPPTGGELDARIEEALQNMKEGSDRFKLQQISEYLANRIEYDVDQEDALRGITTGRGECEVYSELFYRMAARLGIEVHICHGPTGTGYHAWNMVVLDGEPYFYDVTWYDGAIRQPKYLYSTTAWEREYVIKEGW